MGELLYNIFFSNSTNIIINCFNLALFLLGVFILIRALLYLWRSKKELALFKSYFEDPEFSPNKNDLLQQVSSENFSKKGMLHEAIQILFDLSKTSLEDRDKIMYFEDLRNEIRVAVPRAIPTLAVVIGFLGTVIGLFLAINQMPEILKTVQVGTRGSFQQLLDSMAFSLTGMSIAFGTTLVGLSISLVLTLGNLLYRVLWAPYDHEFHKFLALKLFPMFMAPDDENITTYLLKAIDELRSMTKTTELTNTRLLNSVNNLADNMQTYNRENEKILKQVSRAVNQFVASQKENKEIFQAIKDIAQQSGESYQRVEALLDSAQQDRHAFLEYLQDSRDEIKEISTLQHKAYEKTNTAFLGEQQQLQEDFRENFNELQNELLLGQKQINESQEMKLSELHKALMDRIAQDNKERVDAYNEQNAKTQQALETHIKNIANTATSTYQELNKNLANNNQQFHNTIKSFAATVMDNKNQYDDDTKKLISELAALIKKVAESNTYYLGEAS